ncbi:MAG: hypothetical protein AVDCRST_MAG55-598, partial [uncultured Rubrobacteraceae bacterium]
DHGSDERDVRGRGGPAGLEDVRHLHLYLARRNRPHAYGFRHRHLRRLRRRRAGRCHRAQGHVRGGVAYYSVADSGVHRIVYFRHHLLFRSGRKAEVRLDQPRRDPGLRVLVALLTALLFLRGEHRRRLLQRDLRVADRRDPPAALHLLLCLYHADRRGDEPGDRMAHPRRQGRGREGSGGGPQTGRPPARPRKGGGRGPL